MRQTRKLFQRGLFQDRILRDLSAATLAKIAIVLAIYFALFSGYDGRPVDTATHLLGPAPAPEGP